MVYTESNGSLQKKRDSFVDIVKGIGIISIVIGHAGKKISLFGISIRITDFVYTYHIMIFMFVLGFLFYGKGEKRGLIKQTWKTFWSNWKLYFIYVFAFVLLHNLFFNLQMITGEAYNFKQMVICIIKAAFFIHQEAGLSPFWFVPMYVVSAGLFYVCFYIANKASKPCLFHLFFIVLSAAVGFFLNITNIQIYYHCQTSFLAVPVCYLGYFCRKYFSIVRKSLKWYGAILVAAALYGLLLLNVGVVELYLGELMNGWLFYPVTALGIYYCLCLAEIVNKIKYVNNALAYIGKNSFHVMALHCTAFKLLDVCIGRLRGISAEAYSVFPVAFECWYLYYPVGVLLPLLVPLAIGQIKKRIEKIRSKNKKEKESVR